MSDQIILLKTIEVPTMQISLRNDGLVQITVDPGTHVNLPNVKAQIQAIGQLNDGKRYPVLVIAGSDTTMQTDVMNYVAKENSNPFAIAEAYLISSISHKLLANFYLNFNKPARPTRVFTKEQDALKWLYPFRSKTSG
jgi:hypothetical protein